MRLPRTLTSRLVLTAVGLVALVSILIAAATTIAMRDYLTAQLDDKVIGSTDRAGRGPGPMPPGMGEPEFGNQEPGTIVVLIDDDLGFVVADRRGDEKPLSDAAVDVLSDLPRDGHAHEVDLPGYGSYRVAVDEEAGVVTGLPTEDVDDAVAFAGPVGARARRTRRDPRGRRRQRPRTTPAPASLRRRRYRAHRG